MRKNYWFTEKKHGIGLVPATWQGWGVTILSILCIIIVIFETIPVSHNLKSMIENISPYITVIVFIYCVVVVKTGEPIRWRWRK